MKKDCSFLIKLSRIISYWARSYQHIKTFFDVLKLFKNWFYKLRTQHYFKYLSVKLFQNFIYLYVILLHLCIYQVMPCINASYFIPFEHLCLCTGESSYGNKEWFCQRPIYPLTVFMLPRTKQVSVLVSQTWTFLTFPILQKSTPPKV